MKIKFGRRVSELKEAHGLSQREFAKIFDVNEAAVDMWENDVCVPSANLLCKIAVHFCVTVDYLLNYADHPTTEMSTKPKFDDLTADEQYIVDGYRAVSAARKKLITDLVHQLTISSQ